MRKIYIKLQIIAIMLVAGILGCEKKEDKISADIKCIFHATFFESVSFYLYNNDTYIIKGIVLDKKGQGLNIKLIEDLKGNFPKGVNDFIAYGKSSVYINTSFLRRDDLSLYDKQDVLIMHMTKAREPLNSYATIDCDHSIVKLSDDYVTGHILSYEGFEWREDMPLEELTQYVGSLVLREQQNIIDTIPLDDFQKKLNELLTSK